MSILNTATTDSLARLVDQYGDPQHAGFQIRRAWERISALSADGLSVALNDCEWYTNPKADKQQYTGTFIQSRLDPKVNPDDSVDLIQTLTKVKASTDSADADLVSSEGDPATAGFKLNRAWHYISPYALDSLLPALNAIESYTNPKANKEKHTGKFIVSRVRSVEQTDRTYDIIQDMVKVKTITNDSQLTDPLIDRAKDIIHPFGEGTGVGREIIYRYINLDPSSDTYLMMIADTTLVARMSQNDSFIHTNRKTTTEDDRTLTFWVMAQRKQRIAWDSSVYNAPDHIEDENKGRDGNVRHKTWYGIDNDCYAGVLKRLWASKDTGFAILDVKIRDNDDGSDDWSQTLIKYVNDTRTDSYVINPHGLQHNSIKRVHSDFANYDTTVPQPAKDTGYNFVKQEIGLDRNGLIQKTWIQEKPTPSNTSASSAERRGVDSPMAVQLNHTGKVEQYVYDQVPIGSVISALASLDSTSDTRLIVSDISWGDLGQGNAKINRNLKHINSNGSWYIAERSLDNNGGTKAVLREWPYIRDTYADVLMDDLSDSEVKSRFIYNSDSYLSIRVSRTRHYDGTSTVRQYGAVPSIDVATNDANGGGGGVIISVGQKTDSNLHYYYLVDPAGAERAVKVYTKIFDSWASAITFTDAGTKFVDGVGARRLGEVKNIGKGRWQATRVRVV